MKTPQDTDHFGFLDDQVFVGNKNKKTSGVIREDTDHDPEQGTFCESGRMRIADQSPVKKIQAIRCDDKTAECRQGTVVTGDAIAARNGDNSGYKKNKNDQRNHFPECGIAEPVKKRRKNAERKNHIRHIHGIIGNDQFLQQCGQAIGEKLHQYKKENKAELNRQCPEGPDEEEQRYQWSSAVDIVQYRYKYVQEYTPVLFCTSGWKWTSVNYFSAISTGSAHQL